MTKLVIFDLDGTLTDSLASLWYSGNLALADFGYNPLPKELYKKMVGDGAATLIGRMLENSCHSQEKYDEVFTRYRQYFKENCMYELHPYEEVRELLQSLKDRGIKFAVLSNKPHAQTTKIVETIFGKDTFDMILGQRDNVPKKPAPDGVYEILKTLSIEKEDTCYLGDTNTDMRTGKGAGLRTFGVLWGFREEPELRAEGADVILSHPLQLLEYI